MASIRGAAAGIAAALFLGTPLASSLDAQSPAPRAAPAPVAAPAPPSAPAAPRPAPSLEDERTRMAAAVEAPDFPSRLVAAADALPPADGLALILEFGGRAAAPQERQRLIARGADLALLLGRFSDAAEAYTRASAQAAGGRDGPLLLRAARCRLAAGEAEKARDLAALVLLDAADPVLAARAKLAGAWALALEGRGEQARAVASEIAGSKAGAAERREARFLAWSIAAPEARARAAADLAREFPGSPEALISAGAIPPMPLPHWYLGGFGGAGTAPKPGAAPKSGGAAASGPPAAATPPSAAPPSTPAARSAPSAPKQPASAPPGKPAGAAPPPPAAAAAQSSPAPSLAAPSPAGPSAGAAAAAPSSGPSAGSAAPAAAASAGKALRFQVGYFSKEENAKRLQAELATKGFNAKVEAKTQAEGEGRRWLVLVEAGSDPDRTRLRLKDRGYEAYPAFQ